MHITLGLLGGLSNARLHQNKIIWLKKGKKLWGFSLENFKLKKTLGWNHQIVDENIIRDMSYVQMRYFLFSMWMNAEIWSTTIKLYIATLALRKKWEKTKTDSHFSY